MFRVRVKDGQKEASCDIRRNKRGKTRWDKGTVGCKKGQSVHSQSIPSFYYINPFFLNIFFLCNFTFCLPAKGNESTVSLSLDRDSRYQVWLQQPGRRESWAEATRGGTYC